MNEISPSLPSMRSQSFDFCGKKFTIEFGHIAMQSQASVIVRSGDCVLMANIAYASTTNANFFPLTG